MSLRILLAVDTVGGVWHYGLDLARGLAERGVAPALAVLGPAPSPAQRAEAQAIPGARLIETGLPLDWLCDGPAPVLAAGRALARIAAAEHADVVQLNMPALAAVPFPAPVVAVAHGCMSTWWGAARPGEPLPPGFQWHHALMARGLRAADATVAPSAAYARIVAACYDLGHPPIVVHNGRTGAAGVNPPPRHDCVLTAGRLWDAVKHTALLDQVAARLTVPFYAAGPMQGPNGEAAATEHLQPLGTLGTAALAQRLAQRPVFVSAASFEPFGLAVLEAAAAGCALVLSDIPTFRELWDGAAVFAPVGYEAAFSDAIDAIIGDGDRRLRLGDAARARAARYTPAATATAMHALYASVLDSHRPAGRAAA